MNLYAQTIRERIPMREAAARYGLQVDRKGWACCPFHHETKPSLRVYEDGKGWHCFGCGAGGSVIDFVMRAEGVTAQQAIRKLNEDFAVGLPLDAPPDWRTRNRIALEAAKREQALAKQRLDEAKAVYEWEEAFGRWLRLARIAMNSEPLSDPWAYAIRELTEAKYEAMEANQRMIDMQEKGRRGIWKQSKTQTLSS